MPLLADGRTGIIPLQHDTPLIFSHVSIPTKLIIDTGASAIQWGYTLNTNIIPTYGGEVGQILSATVDAITITGQTRNNNQLKDIYEWFLQYMQLAGLHNREEQAIKFSYPERGWEFYIQVRDAPNFEYNRDKIAIPWTITAEIVADNDLNFLSGHTMSLMGEAVTFDPSLYDVGFNVEQPSYQPNFGATLSENFQSLLGSWATGDFAHWGFQVLNSPKQNKLNPDAAQIFKDAFGSDFIAGKNPGGGTSAGAIGGAYAYTGPKNPSTKAQIVQDIYFSFQLNSVPGVLGVTVAMIESGFDPNARNGVQLGLFQTNPRGRGGSGKHVSQLNAAEANGPPVTKWYPSGSQIADAAGWFPGFKPSGVKNDTNDAHDLWLWAVQAQLGGTSQIAGNAPYEFNNFLQSLNAAKKLVGQFINSGSVAGYANPLRGINSLGIGRIDEGVDYTGSGPLYAIGPARISYASSNTGWPGGTFISYTLEQGAAAGKTVYIAENITPSRKWSKGDFVTAQTALGTLHNSYPYMEIGWAVPGVDLAMAHGVYHEGAITAFGVNFAHFLKALGAPAPTSSTSGVGSLPPNWPKW